MRLINGGSAAAYRPFGALRFFLATMVVVGHSRFFAGEELSTALAPWGLGNIAVMSFFVLSGLIIAEALESFYVRRAWTFLTNRFLRIVPTYVVALLLSIGIYAYLESSQALSFLPGDYKNYPVGMFSFKNIGANLLLVFSWEQLPVIGSFFEQTYYFVRYVWAVSVEVQFYVAVIFLYSLSWGVQDLGSRCGVNLSGKHVGKAVFVIGALICLLLAMLWKAGTGLLWSFSFSAYFIFGIALYYSLKSGSAWAFGAAAVSYALSVFHLWNYLGTVHYTTAAVVVFSGLIVSIILLFPITLSPSLEKLDKARGDLSYPIYLNHYVWTVLAWNTLEGRSLLLFCAVILSCVLFSWAASRLSEPLVAAWRDKVRGKRLRS